MMKIIVKTLIFGMVLPGMLIGLFPYLILSHTSQIRWHLGLMQVIGLVPLVAGGGIVVWCWWDFFRIGKGTPSPTDPPTSLVVTGCYRVTRNPMYVGIASVLLGEAVAGESVVLGLYGSLIVLLFHLFVRYYEEPILTKTFGTTYTTYCETVPRWVPGGHWLLHGLGKRRAVP